MIQYKRTGGSRPPRDRELLTVDDKGEFSLWRSIGAAVFPPTAVGRFAGQLNAGDLAALQKLTQAAQKAGDLAVVPLPGSVIERVILGDGVNARLGIHDEPDGPWGALLARLRQLLADLTAHPQAALKLTVTAKGDAARLAHLGDQPLRLDLSGLAIRAVLWEGYKNLGDWRYSGPAEWEGDIVAEPGWSLELPFAHGHAVRPSMEVVAYVTLAAYDGRRLVPIGLESPRQTAS
jgi:hypothetical protein